MESIYEEALAWELSQRGISVERQKEIPVTYKAASVYNNIFEAQLLTYLRLSNLKLGLVINFGEGLVKNGIHRVVNGLDR